jgi:type VI secretion system protein ImpL
MKNWAIVIGAYLVYLAMTYGVARLLNLAQAKLYLFLGILAVLGLAAIALYVYLKGKKDELDAGGGAAEAGGASEAEQLIRAASARLIQSKAAGGAGISNLPLVFVMGDRNSAKTSVILHSGLEPELLAGQIYGENNAVAPTRAANIWFARGTAFVEAGGQLLADPSNWVKLVKKLSPGAWKSLVGGGGRAPRAVLLCFDVENFLRQGAAEEIAAATRYLQARLGEVSETLGIRYPVYVLFTRADRLPFFADYVRTLNNEEANQVFGATLPMSLSANLGLYAEEESKRLSIAFNNLFHSLCDKRLHFLPREGDPEKLPGTYEFPREFRKLRNSLVQFLVEVCRPSQLRASPFLRGFYFSGVRPITVADIPPPVAAPQQETLQASGGATRMFRVGMEAELKAKQAMAQAQSQGRRVPQWLFLGHLFHSVILNDTPALQASGSSVKTSMLQRVLLAAAASLLLIYGGLLTVSFFQNRALENRIAAAANDLKAAGALVQGFPDEAGLRKLETLRAALEELVRYQKEGRPTMMGWGLWTGDALLAPARKAYYGRFRDLLFGQTQAGMLAFLNSRPDVPAPTDDYGYGYDTLKSYLLTTSEWQRSSDPNLEKFLAARLYDRWKQDKDAEIGQARLELAKKQFDFYAWDLKNGNPYSTNTDTNAVTKTRIYLSKFTGIDRFYQALLALADAKGPAVSFNQKYPGSGEVLISPVPVRYAFTKAGWDFLKGQIENANIGGEPWVLGEYLGQIPPKDQLKSAILERYTADFIKQWREVLKKSSVVRYASFPDAARKLGKLSSPQTPLLGLMWWTSTNTGLNDLPKVVNAFQAVHKVVPPAQQELYIVDPNRNYNSALITLQGSFERAGPNPNPAAFTQANNDAISARGVAQQLIATFPPDTEAQLDKDVARLLLQRLRRAQLLRRLGTANAQVPVQSHGTAGGDIAGIGRHPAAANRTFVAVV